MRRPRKYGLADSNAFVCFAVVSALAVSVFSSARSSLSSSPGSLTLRKTELCIPNRDSGHHREPR